MKALLIICSTIATAVVLVVVAIRSGQEIVTTLPSPQTKLKGVALAIHNWTEHQGELPTNLHDEDGSPILSWRVQVAQYLDTRLTIDVKSRWDTAGNQEAAKAIPSSLRNIDFYDGIYPFGCRTQILGVFSESGAWNGAGDAEEAVLLVDGQPVQCVWAAPQFSVLWTQPLDLSVADVERLLERDHNSATPDERRIQYVSLKDGRVFGPPFEWDIK